MTKRPGGLGERVLAHIVDGVFLFLPLFALWAVALRGIDSLLVQRIITNGLSVAYFVTMESRTGATLGKRLFGLSVQNQRGANPTFEQALFRNAYLGLGVIPGLAGSMLGLAAIVWIAVTINADTVHRQGWHDRLANATFVTKRSAPALDGERPAA